MSCRILFKIFHPSSQALGLGPGTGPGPGPGACEEGWKMLFFSNGFASRCFCTQDPAAEKGKNLSIFYIFSAANLYFPSFFAGAQAWARARAWARGLRRRMENVFFFSNGLSSRDSTHTAPTLQLISGPCSIEKVSSRMANRYTRIFDAGGHAT